jgi:hypothetical protein
MKKADWEVGDGVEFDRVSERTERTADPSSSFCSSVNHSALRDLLVDLSAVVRCIDRRTAAMEVAMMRQLHSDVSRLELQKFKPLSRQMCAVKPTTHSDIASAPEDSHEMKAGAEFKKMLAVVKSAGRSKSRSKGQVRPPSDLEPEVEEWREVSAQVAGSSCRELSQKTAVDDAGDCLPGAHRLTNDIIMLGEILFDEDDRCAPLCSTTPREVEAFLQPSVRSSVVSDSHLSESGADDIVSNTTWHRWRKRATPPEDMLSRTSRGSSRKSSDSWAPEDFDQDVCCRYPDTEKEVSLFELGRLPSRDLDTPGPSEESSRTSQSEQDRVVAQVKDPNLASDDDTELGAVRDSDAERRLATSRRRLCSVQE